MTIRNAGLADASKLSLLMNEGFGWEITKPPESSFFTNDNILGWVSNENSKKRFKFNRKILQLCRTKGECSYYETKLKEDRLNQLRSITLKKNVKFNFFKENIN